MKTLLQTFTDIALLCKGPQDLPASRTLAWSLLVLYAGVEFMLTQLFQVKLRTAVLMILIDVAMLTGWMWAVLTFFGRRQRFVQTATAVLGVSILLLLLDIAMRTVQLASGMSGGLPDEVGLLRFLLFALILGRIFMHALDRSLLTGMALTVAIVFSTTSVVDLLLDGI
jgi:hypothetical protein